GTPAYMSPEQHFGHLSGPYSDQFSFAVTLYEALYGARPFVGDSWASIKTQVESGVVPPPPPDSPVPRRLFKILLRALSTAPEKRWPTLGEMLDALEHDPQRARIRVAAMVGLLGAASAGSYAVAIARAPEADRCEAGAKEMASVWGEERRTAVARAFASTGTPFAADVLQRVEERLDSYTKTWASEHRLACESNAAGLETTRLMDLRFACLGRRKVHMQALLDVFTTASGEVVENAVQAVAALPGVQACADAEVLLADVAPPGDPETARKVDALRERLARGAALEGTGGYAEGLQVVQAARAEAITVGYAPLTAEAALAEGSLLTTAGRLNEAEAALAEAVRLGIAQDMHAVAAEAAARRIFVIGVGLRDHPTALASQLFAEALVERASDDGRLEALLLNNLGTVFALKGDDAAARTHFQKTIELLRSSGDADPLLAVVHHNLAEIDLKRGNLEGAEDNSTRAHALFIALLGQRHPLVAHPLAGLGDVELKRGNPDNLVLADKRYREALALMEAGHGPEHPYLLHPLTGLGRVAARQGNVEQARRRFDRVVAIAERNEFMHPLLGEALEELGELSAAEGDGSKALASFERAVQVYGDDHELRAAAIRRAGEMAAKLKDPAPAIAWFERIVASAPGPVTDAPMRLAAALALARLYAGSDRVGPVCELLREAEAALPVVDDRRERVAAGLKSCPPR
ncbi:MAG TPA: tetratricopeptide repeat-containing protein kinase family protein, partial [Nannocystis sp.]